MDRLLVLRSFLIVFLCFTVLIVQPSIASDSEDSEECTIDETGDKTSETKSSPTEAEPDEVTKTIVQNNFCPLAKTSSRHRPGGSNNLHRFYELGLSAQSYKPNAPRKNQVCEGANYYQHRVAHWPFWRKTYRSMVPMLVRGKIHGCEHIKIDSTKFTMEVWQARPDGTYSSLRPGVQEGECRATIPLSSSDNEQSTGAGVFAQVQFQTVAPGSVGALGGLIPSSSSGDYPFYGPGIIHIFVNAEGYQPMLTQISMEKVGNSLLQNENTGSTTRQNRFRFSRWTRGPGNSPDEMEIKTVRHISHSESDEALEVEIDFFLVPSESESCGGSQGECDEEKFTAKEIFCTQSRGYFGWMSSFFKEPIAVCEPSLLDFYAL